MDSVWQFLHGSRNGVSFLLTGCGFAAYASSLADALLMPSANATGDMPLGVLRGEVTPPATLFALFARCNQAQAGLSTCLTYSAGDTGAANRCRFGSFQAVHSRTHGYRRAAAYAKFPTPLVGMKFCPLPPFAHAGEPQIVTSVVMWCACRPFMTGSNACQSYARSFGLVGDVGSVGAISLHTSVKRTIFTPSESSVLRRDSSVPGVKGGGPQRSHASSWTPNRSGGVAAARPANRTVAVAANAAVMRRHLMAP